MRGPSPAAARTSGGGSAARALLSACLLLGLAGCCHGHGFMMSPASRCRALGRAEWECAGGEAVAPNRWRFCVNAAWVSLSACHTVPVPVDVGLIPIRYCPRALSPDPALSAPGPHPLPGNGLGASPYAVRNDLSDVCGDPHQDVGSLGLAANGNLPIQGQHQPSGCQRLQCVTCKGTLWPQASSPLPQAELPHQGGAAQMITVTTQHMMW